MAKQDVSLQLTSQNEAPVGSIRLVNVGGSENVPITTTMEVPINTSLGVDLSRISDPDGDDLSYKFAWYHTTKGFVSRQATYTPDSIGKYQMSMDIHDGNVTITRLIDFFIVSPPEEQSSGQDAGSAMTGVVRPDGDFVPDAGMDDLGTTPLTEFV